MKKVVTSNENLKTLCRQLVKIEIILFAANNGNTLVEAIISAKRTSPDQDNQKKILNRKRLRNFLNIIINYKAFHFHITVILKRRKLMKILTKESHDIRVKIFNIVDRATATRRRIQPRQGCHLTHSDICILPRSSRSQ